jgi:hypothetical protein
MTGLVITDKAQASKYCTFYPKFRPVSGHPRSAALCYNRAYRVLWVAGQKLRLPADSGSALPALGSFAYPPCARDDRIGAGGHLHVVGRRGDRR